MHESDCFNTIRKIKTGLEQIDMKNVRLNEN